MQRLKAVLSKSGFQDITVNCSYEIKEERVFVEHRFSDRPSKIYGTQFDLTPARKEYFETVEITFSTLQYAQWCIREDKNNTVDPEIQKSLEAGYRINAHTDERKLAGLTGPAIKFRTAEEQEAYDKQILDSKRISKRTMPELKGQLHSIDIFDL